MITKLVLLLPLFIIGCSTQVVSSSERSVIVESQSMNIAEAQKLANAECAKYKKFARMTVKADYWERNYIFDCIQ